MSNWCIWWLSPTACSCSPIHTHVPQQAIIQRKDSAGATNTLPFLSVINRQMILFLCAHSHVHAEIKSHMEGDQILQRPPYFLVYNGLGLSVIYHNTDDKVWISTGAVQVSAVKKSHPAVDWKPPPALICLFIPHLLKKGFVVPKLATH